MISVVIPTYKKRQQLIDNLQNNMPHLAGCEVIVVNDFPTESIKEDMKPFNITLIENRTNLGFGGAVNAGVAAAKGDLILLLNSDVVLKDDSYKKAISHFKDNDKLFGVSFAQREKDGKLVGKNEIYWQRGFFHHRAAKNLTAGKNGWAEGGSSLLKKNVYERLGGFDLLYTPFYWEDIDLSYRAWKSGYEILFDPEVVVTHHHESTIGTYFTPRHVKKIAYRNQFSFMWKNITDPSLLIAHKLWVYPTLFQQLIRGDVVFIQGFFLAIGKLFTTLKARSQAKKTFTLTDKEVLSSFS